MRLKASRKMASELDLVLAVYTDEVKGQDFVVIETPSDYSVGLFGGEVARVYRNMTVRDDKELLAESQLYVDLSFEDYLNDIHQLVSSIKSEMKWEK